MAPPKLETAMSALRGRTFDIVFLLNWFRYHVWVVVAFPGCRQTYPVHYLATPSAAAFAEPLVASEMRSATFCAPARWSRGTYRKRHSASCLRSIPFPEGGKETSTEPNVPVSVPRCIP